MSPAAWSLRRHRLLQSLRDLLCPGGSSVTAPQRCSQFSETERLLDLCQVGHAVCAPLWGTAKVKAVVPTASRSWAPFLLQRGTWDMAQSVFIQSAQTTCFQTHHLKKRTMSLCNEQS